jgi:hypothetical protein
MQQDSEKPKKAFPWGTPVSILVHLAIAAAFLLNIPSQQPTPDQEQAVNVELVPPAEEKKPEEKKPEEAKKEEKKPEEPKPQEKPPEPPKVEAKKEEPPPPSPPKEEAKEPETQKQEAQPPRQDLPVLHPVFEYGQKDTGPKVADKGNAAVDEAKPEETPTPVPPAPKPDEVKPPEKPATANPLPKEIELPKVAVTESGAAKDGPTAIGVDEAKTSLVPETAPEPTTADQTDKTEPKPDAKPPQQDKLKRAKTLLSKQAMSSPRAQSAMGDLSREDRIGILCASELQAQLRQGTPAHIPELLPRLKGTVGNVLSQTRSFRDNTGWYDITFRCEVDDDATKVDSFAYGVGNAVPKSEWRSRGFPRN